MRPGKSTMQKCGEQRHHSCLDCTRITMPFSSEDKVIVKHYVMDKGYGYKRILKEFPDKNWSLGGLKKLIKRIKDREGDLARKKGSGENNPKKLPDEVLEEVEDLICSQENEPNTHLSQNAIARQLNVHQSTISRAAKKRGLKPFKKVKTQALTEANKEKRLARCRRLLRVLTREKVSKTFFTDEKIFQMEPPHNRHNDRVYARNQKDISDERLHRTKSAFPQSVMISAGVSTTSKTPIYFVEPGVKVNAAYYQESILSKMLPDMHRLSNGDDFVFMQDGARAHTARSTIEYLDGNCPEYVPSDMWPPNPCDLNPLDSAIWGDLERRMWERHRHGFTDLAF